MKVLLLESNLLWSRRLVMTLESAGHVAEVATLVPGDGAFDVAIVNLSDPRVNPFEAVRELKQRGVLVFGHAGHKEKELIEEGQEAGCDRILSNGQLTFKLPEILSEFQHAG